MAATAAQTEKRGRGAERLGLEPASPEALLTLPLFRTSTPAVGISPCELHESWLADMPVHKLPLSGHAIRALGLNGIKRLGQLLMTPGRSLLELRGIGRAFLAAARAAAAYAVLGEVPENLVVSAAEPRGTGAGLPAEEEPVSLTEGSPWDVDPWASRAQAALPARDTWSRPVSEDALFMLPIFSGFGPPGLSPGDLHETYLPDVPVEYLFLSGHAGRRDPLTIGRMLLTPADALAARRGWERMSSATVQQALLDAILVPVTWPDTSAPGGLLDVFLKHVVGSGRNPDIVRLRIGLSAGRGMFLAEAGKRYGITKQAAHYAYHKTIARLGQGRFLRLLARLWFRVDAVTGKHGSMPRLDRLLDELGAPPGEERARDARALEFLLKLRTSSGR
jgi:hypothetical protein